MHHINTDAQAFEQRKAQRLLAAAKVTADADAIKAADATSFERELANLYERQAQLAAGESR